MNDVKIIGNLTRDPEIKYLPSGMAVCNITLGVNRSYKQGDDWKKETAFVEVKVWGKSAEKLAVNSKGDKFLVEGRLAQDSWEKEGKKFSKLYVNAFKVYPFGSLEEKPAQSEIPQSVKEEYEEHEENLPF